MENQTVIRIDTADDSMNYETLESDSICIKS